MWLNKLNSFTLILALISNCYYGAEYEGIVFQDLYNYLYEEYWSKDEDSCIVSNSTFSLPDSPYAGVPSIQKCDGKYQINNSTLVLPRNTMPMCAYTPAWYDGTVQKYLTDFLLGLKQGNSTFDSYECECMEVVSANTKTQVLEMYGVKPQYAACVRYSDFLTTTYGLDPEIVDVVNKVEAIIEPEYKWTNTLIQARLFASTLCFATNKAGCVALLNHLLNEKDNSILNLFGYKISGTPSTWLYADGFDIEILHILVEIMGKKLEVNQVDDIFYYHVSPDSPSDGIIKYKPGLVGGFHK